MTRLDLPTVATIALLLSAVSATPMKLAGRASAKTKLTQEEIQQVLAAHNAYRGACAAEQLTWSDDAAAAAQAWINQCPGGDGEQHGGMNYNGKKYGQNIASQKGSRDLVGMVMDQWCGKDERSEGGLNHFTQVVWKGSKQVGCGINVCDGWNTMICDYYPAGNMQGDRDQNVSQPKSIPPRPSGGGSYGGGSGGDQSGGSGNGGGYQGGNQGGNQGGEQGGDMYGNQGGDQGGDQYGNQGGDQGGDQGGQDSGNYGPGQGQDGKDGDNGYGPGGQGQDGQDGGDGYGPGGQGQDGQDGGDNYGPGSQQGDDSPFGNYNPFQGMPGGFGGQDGQDGDNGKGNGKGSYHHSGSSTTYSSSSTVNCNGNKCTYTHNGKPSNGGKYDSQDGDIDQQGNIYGGKGQSQKGDYANDQQGGDDQQSYGVDDQQNSGDYDMVDSSDYSSSAKAQDKDCDKKQKTKK